MRPSKSFLIRTLASAALLVLANGYTAFPTEKEGGPDCPGGDWGYAEDNGPDHWAELSPCNCQCGNGGEQSPIDIVRTQRMALPPLRPSYRVVQELPVVHNGHEIRATIPSSAPAEDVTLRIGDVDFRL